MPDSPKPAQDDTLRNGPQWHLVFVLYAQSKKRESSKPLFAQECVYLIKASAAIDAYRRALKVATDTQHYTKRERDEEVPVKLFRIGVTEVMPVWETFADGNELGFRDVELDASDDLDEMILSEEDVLEEDEG